MDLDEMIRVLREEFDAADAASELAVQRFREACRKMATDPDERRRIEALAAGLGPPDEP